MARRNSITTHPDRARLETELISGRNILQMASETGISSATLYAARARLIAERDARNDADADATRLGAAKRLAVLAADVRKSRLDANLQGNGRLAKDLAEVERKIISDITNLSPEGQQLQEAQDASRSADQFSAALVAVLKLVNSSLAFETAANTLRAEGATDAEIAPLVTAANTLRKVGK